jgi:hypothetical protein
VKEGRVALRAGDSLDHLEEVIGAFHADRLRARLSQTDVLAGDRIEYDFDGEGSSLSIVSDNFQRATKYFDDLNRIQGDGLVAELEARTFATDCSLVDHAEVAPSQDGGPVDAQHGTEGDRESLVRAKANKDAHDAARIEKTIAYFAKRNGQRLHAVTLERPAGAVVLGILAIFVQRRHLNRVFGQTVADMREECLEAIASKKPWRYRAAWFRGHLSIAFTVIAFLGASVVKRFVEIWKAV